MTPPLEVVYYPRATPLSHDSLTFMALAFERIHFPGVYVPPGDFDRARLTRALDEARNDPKEKPPDYARVMNAFRVALHRDDLRQFCVFSEDPSGLTSVQEKDASALAANIIQSLGSTPPASIGRELVHWTQLHLENGVMRFPSAFEYPANALLYANKRGIPLLNDDRNLPVPAVRNESSAENAAILSAVLSAECIRLALPVLPRLSIPQLVEVRQELAAPLKDFRNTMIRLSSDLNAMIRAGDDDKALQAHAKFLLSTTVAPTISELEVAFQKSSQPWLKRAFESAKTIPDLVVACATLSPTAVAKALGSLGSLLFSFRDSQSAKHDVAKRTGLYYVLKLRQRAASSIS